MEKNYNYPRLNRKVYSIVGRNITAMICDNKKQKGSYIKCKEGETQTFKQLQLLIKTLKEIKVEVDSKQNEYDKFVIIYSDKIRPLIYPDTFNYWINTKTYKNGNIIDDKTHALLYEYRNLLEELRPNLQLVDSRNITSREFATIYNRSWQCLEKVEPKYKEFEAVHA